MPRPRAVPGGVRDLVEDEPGRAQPLVGEEVLLGVAVVVGRRRRAARDPAGERGARFDGEAVQREVRGREPDRRIEIAPPVPPQLRREREDQVQ